MGGSATLYIDTPDKVVIKQLLFAYSGCSRKVAGIMRNCCCFEHHDFFEFYSFAQGKRIIDKTKREAFFFEPQSCKCMISGKNYQAVQTRLLETGAKQQRQIQASAKLVVQYNFWKSDLLPTGFKTGWRNAVVYLTG